MASGSGFFKGETKKKKKGGKQKMGGITPVFVPPQVVGKNKKNNQ